MFSFRSKLLCTTGLALFVGSSAALAASPVAIGGKQLAPLPTAQPGGIHLAACNPCATSACNPCNPCAAAACNPCNPCNPCAAKKKKINPCNPCGANPCAAAACNPCNPCNPCAAKTN